MSKEEMCTFVQGFLVRIYIRANINSIMYFFSLYTDIMLLVG